LDLIGRKWLEDGEDSTMRSFITCILHHVLLGLLVEENKMGGTCGMHGKMRNEYKILVGKPEGKKSLGSPRGR
jgi:hypothetical protein